MSVSEEFGSEYRKTHLILVSFAGFFALPRTVSWFYSRPLFHSIQEWRQVFNIVLQETFFVSAHTYILFFCICSNLPLSSANADTFPVFGDSFLYESFPYFWFQSHYFRYLISAHTYPFRRLRRHLSLKAERLTHLYSVASLLDKRDSLHYPYIFFFFLNTKKRWPDNSGHLSFVICW